MTHIGPYKLIRTIAKGGMGEVFLAYDPDCKREIALKCIRSEYANNSIIYKRFVKEALIASRLTHPSIIPIYHLCNDGKRPYYTMPYIPGKTLKQILIETANQEQNSQNLSSQEGSIPYLTHIFLTICEAVHYAHSQQIIHRDLKPENILVGQYGEVLIFDWGVADKIENIAKEDPSYEIEGADFPHLTSPGKIIGTLSFLAPERFLGQPANYLTDIYSLGVMLYMILTLKLPFKRKEAKETKENIHKEVFKNPIDIAPYRDIPHSLVQITQNCLNPDPKLRYQNMGELLKDLKNFTEGQFEWLFSQNIELHKSSDWEFSENILIPNHQAISSKKNALEWISLNISKEAFEINCQIETTIKIENEGAGIGLLINSSSASNRHHIMDGYHLWLSAKADQTSLLFRNNVKVLLLPHLTLKPGSTYRLRLEKRGHLVQFYLDDVKQFSYLSYLPLMHTHVGVIYKDSHFEIEPLKISIASPSLIISCLEVPDAFLAQKNYIKALNEYRRVGKAFPGRHESREALFRAGLCLMGQATIAKEKEFKNKFLNLALDEFENLRHTPGAPLEYLGKALVYQEYQDIEEELKCLELSLRRYSKHPLLYLIYDHIIYRLYQCSHYNRINTYKFIFLALRYNAYAYYQQMIDPLILNLTDKQSTLFFLEKEASGDLQKRYLELVIDLGFLLQKNYVFDELAEQEHFPSYLKRNIAICSWILKEQKSFESHVLSLDLHEQKLINKLVEPISEKSFNFITEESDLPSFQEHLFYLLTEKSVRNGQHELLFEIYQKLKEEQHPFSYKKHFCYYYVLILLLTKHFEKAKLYLEKKSDLLDQMPHRTLFLKGCLLYGMGKQKESLELFSKELVVSAPDVDRLAPLFLSNQLDQKKWLKESFAFERASLDKQLFYYYQIGGNHEEARKYLKKWKMSIGL